MKKLLLSLFGLFLFTSSVFAAYPTNTNYINDSASVISQPIEDQLNKKLSDYDKQTTNQIFVLTVNTTGNESIEDYSIHVADQWKPGVKGKDNGILMTFAMKDRKMRIEVGRGLEGELTDLKSKEIITNIITPQFKQGKYESGISQGIDQVILSLSTQSAQPIQTTSNNSGGIIVLIVLGIIVLVFFVVAVSPVTPLGGEGTYGVTDFWKSSDSYSSPDSSESDSSDGSGSGFGGSSDGGGSSDDGGGFSGGGGGSFSGGGSSGSW